MKKAISFIMILMVSCFLFTACAKTSKDKNELWENAIYHENTQLGEGENGFELNITADEKTVTLNIKTDCKTVGEALSELKLVSGEHGAYGLYVKEVNGIIADYSVTKSYWSFYKDGEYLQTGVDQTEFKNGDTFDFVYTEA